MSSALFGPDGTQLPEPEPVLPDALVSPPAAAGDRDLFPPLTLPALTLRPDQGSVADEFLPTPPRGFPLPVPPRPAQPVRRPPAVARGRSRQSGQQPHRPPPPPRPQPDQPRSYRPAPSAPPEVYRPAPSLPSRPPAAPPVALPSPLLHERRSNGWIGCVVVLVFSIGAFFPVVRALIDTVLGLVR